MFRSDDVIEPSKSNNSSGISQEINEKETKKVKRAYISSLETSYGSASKDILKVLGERHSNSQAMMEGANGTLPLVRFLIFSPHN